MHGSSLYVCVCVFVGGYAWIKFICMCEFYRCICMDQVYMYVCVFLWVYMHGSSLYVCRAGATGGREGASPPHSDYPAPSLKMSVKIDFIYEI